MFNLIEIKLVALIRLPQVSIQQKQTRFQFVFQHYFSMPQKFAITPKMLRRTNWLSGNLMPHELNQ